LPALFIELFSEEIPAHMQQRGAETLARALTDALASLKPEGVKLFSGPRRIAVAADVADAVPASSSIERGPRIGAPEQALAGFLRKHGAGRSELREEGGFYVLEKSASAVRAETLIASVMPDVLRRFAWPKSMRWGGTSAFTWVRPLRRILCLLGGRVVEFSLSASEDDGHGLTSGDVTEGHRFMAPGPLSVRNVDEWERALEQHFVIASATERRARVADGIAAAAATRNLSVVEDPGLIDEVCGLVEWPVALLGRIDDTFMDLPAEVMQVSMRVNQRYFATRTADGRPAPWFAFAANIEAADGGAAIIAGNERVLRARFADARHFWDLDRRTKLADRVAALDGVTFHASLGTQGARVRRLLPLAAAVAHAIGADVAQAERAALLCKADLTTGMVGEFPELQGVMGGYYARHDGEEDAVADAVRDHYAPKGVSDPAPTAPVTIAVALADKLDQIAGFFSQGLAPTGSGDPFALRRAALGIIRTIRDNGLRLRLLPILSLAASAFVADERVAALASDILNFLHDRIRVQFRADGGRADVLLAALNTAGPKDDIVLFLHHAGALADLLLTEDGVNLLAAYKRAANILAIENKRDKTTYGGPVDTGMLVSETENALYSSINDARIVQRMVADEDFGNAVKTLATLRRPLDEFFVENKVNDDNADVRKNRLVLLSNVKDLIDTVGYFDALNV
jgi:glycyl-tRNA synthetase beta chain